MKDLIIKYFTNTISSLELIELSKLLKDKKNRKLFKIYVKEYYDVDVALQNVDLEFEYLDLIKKIEKKRINIRFVSLGWYKWAAVFIGIIGLSYFFILNSENSNALHIDKNTITLKLNNGNIKVISEDGNEKIRNKDGLVIGTQEGTTLDYENKNNKDHSNNLEELLTYNELTIPYGKTFHLILSDGTHVHINAGTTFKYPVKFLPGKKRQVFIEGEAFFDVVKQENHSFIVSTKDINIRALGTQFNVNSYSDSEIINTVLVEGSVGIYREDQNFDPNTSVILNPGHIASWNKSGKNIQVKKVDVTEYTAWTEGVLHFKNRPFSEIIKVLKRHYNVSITNNYERLNNQRFFAKFDSENIEQVLNSFKNSEPFSFEIKGEQITINNPKKNDLDEFKN